MKDVMKMLFGGDFQSQVYKKGGMLSPHQRYVLEIEGLTGVRKEAIESYIAENKLSDNDVLNIVIGLGRKQLKGSDFSSAVVGVKGNDYSKKIISFAKDNKAMKLEFGGGFQSGVYADGGYFDGSIPDVSSYMTNYAKGGSLEAHGIEIGDTFVKTISGNIQKIKDKNGKIVYVDLSTGERDSQPPLPFDDGGDIDLTDDNVMRVRKPAMPTKKLSNQEIAEKYNASAYEFMTDDKKMMFGGDTLSNLKNIFTKDVIYKTDEQGYFYVILKPLKEQRKYENMADEVFYKMPEKYLDKDDVGDFFIEESNVFVPNAQLSSQEIEQKFGVKLSNKAKEIYTDKDKAKQKSDVGELVEKYKLAIKSKNYVYASKLKKLIDEVNKSKRFAFGGGLFSRAKMMTKAKKYPDLEDKNVTLKNGKLVKVFSQNENKLKVIEFGKIGSGVAPTTIDISEVETIYKGGGALVGNQKRIDMNKNGKIDAEDFKLLRSSMNGAWRNERKHVNHNEDYEVRYARKKPSRTGYKGKRKFEGGGGISNFERFSNVVAKNYEGKSVKPKYQKEYGKTYSKSEAKQVGNRVAGKVKMMKKAESGAEVKKGNRGGVMVLAKKIRKDGESWKDALKRAGQQLK